MSEISKKRGEFGEKVTEKLLQSIGWTDLLNGREIECFKPVEHSISTKDRKDHGVDFIFQYDCPLFNDTQVFVIISSKINDDYPSNPNAKFKSHLRDIAYALDCFKKSTLRSKLRNTKANFNYRQIGVICWIDNKNNYDDVLDRLTELRIDDDLEFDTVYLVDNRRADFLFDTMHFAKSHFLNATIEFYHPNTGYNVTARNRISSSPVLPVQYINSSILPLKVINQNEEYLILNCIDKFEGDYLKRLISLAQKLTENWGQKVYILFPEYNSDSHKDEVDDIKLSFKDRRFTNKLVISSFNPNFRNVEPI